MLRTTAIPEPLQAYLDSLVHPVARNDALTAARHRAFIGLRLLVGLIALAAIPVLFAVHGVPSPIEVTVLAWLLAPLLVVRYLSRTGDFEGAHLASAALLTGIVALVAAGTGGMTSFAIVWLAVIPLEPALSASRRVVLTTIALSVAAMTGLFLASHFGSLPAAAHGVGACFLATLSAGLYAGAIALGANSLARRAEGVRQWHDARYQFLSRNMEEVVTRHGPSGAVSFVSTGADRLLQTPAASLTGHGWFDRVHVADRPAFLIALAAAGREGKSSADYRLRVGETSHEPDWREPVFAWVETNFRGHSPREVIGVTRDIARRRVDAAALDSMRAESERAKEEKNRLLAVVSHELRTPLNAIIGFSELIRSDAAVRIEPERRADYARLIHESGRHLLSVVDGILDVSRIDGGRMELLPETCAVAPLVRNCCELMLLRAGEAGLRLDADLASAPSGVRADPRALRQILINLIANAIKFTPRGGSVRVLARQDASDLVLVVIDSGIGVAEEDLAQLGDPFFQVPVNGGRTREGSGLGLSVVKGLVQLHGGKLEIRSRIGQGTRVTVRLPILVDLDAGAALCSLERPGHRQPACLEISNEKVQLSA